MLLYGVGELMADNWETAHLKKTGLVIGSGVN